MSEPDRGPSGRVDVCVVGAGPAGSILASELAAAGREVVMLEAGPRFDKAEREARMDRALRPPHGPSSIWDMGGPRDAYASSGPAHYPLNHKRVKGVGGSTLHWQGLAMRLHERDFETETRDDVGRDWPIDYADLRPYYAAAERALGVAGAADNPFGPPREEPYPMPAFPPSYSDAIFADACESLGIAMHSTANARNSEPYGGAGPCVGFGTCRPVCPSGAKYDATRHVDAAEADGVRVIDRAPVQRLEHDDAGDSVTTAVYATPDGREHRQRARQFVVACGGIETPRLLLLSRSSTYPDGLANGSDCVGRYLMDHVFAGTGGRIDRRTRQHHVGFLTSESHQFYDDPARGTAGVPPADAEPGEIGPIKLEFFNYAGPAPVEAALTDGDWGDDLLDRLRSDYGQSLAVGALVGQVPRRENRVRLDTSRTDDHGNPVPDIRWGLDGRTRRTMARANEIQERILGALDAEVTWQVGPENTGPAAHPMGTTRMGTDPAESVVDPHLRTHDLSNCWIVSSSVFPTGGAANPTLTIAALALRAAEDVEAAL